VAEGHPNLVITRTFSKATASGGCASVCARQASVADVMNRVRQPFT